MDVYRNLDQISESFIIFDDPLDKYSQLIDFGKQAKGLSEENKIDINKIRGCVSQAWVIVSLNKNDLVEIQTDSDSFIVRGLLSILDKILYNVNRDDVLMIDANKILQKLGIKDSITSQRTNGFISAINTIKNILRRT